MKLISILFFMLCLHTVSAQNEAWLDSGGVNLLEEGQIVAPKNFHCNYYGPDSVEYDCIGVHYKGESEYFKSVITDSTGNVIYETTDINDCWNGFSNDNKRIPPGVYFWHIKAKMIKSDVEYEHQGMIYLFCITEDELKAQMDKRK